VFAETPEAALQRVADGSVRNITAVAALQWLALNKATVRARWTA